MKKIFSLLVTILLISALLLSACGKGKDDSKGTDTPGQTQTGGTTGGETGGTDQPAEPDKPDALGFIPAADPSRIPAASKSRTDTIIVGMQNTSGIFNPFFYSTAYDSYVIDTIFEGLAKVSQDASIVPSLATWKTSADGLVWTFNIDPNATWSDGKPVTAEDVSFTFHVFLDPAYDGRSNYMNAKIKGADAYKNGDAATIEGIKVVDEKTIEITVDEVNALTLNYLATVVLPKHYYGEGYTKGNMSPMHAKDAEPMGSGPWVFKSYVPGQEVRLEANANYWKKDEVPKMKNLIFKATTDETNIAMLEAGETDFEEGISVSKDRIEMLQGMGFLDLNLLLNNGYGYVAINHEVEKFKDKRVRQALVYGLDRESAVFAYSQGYAQVIDVPQSQLSWAYPDTSKVTHYAYNLEKAKALLDEAGWVVGADGYRYKDGEKFTIDFAATTPNPVNEALVPIAVENYKELGIEFVAEQLEFGAVVEKLQAGNYEMGFLAVGLGVDPDPYGLFHTNGGSNYYRYSNPKVDSLIEQGIKEIDQAKRKEIYNEVYQILNDEIPVILMYQRYNLNTINTRLTGFDITPYYDFANSLNLVTVE